MWSEYIHHLCLHFPIVGSLFLFGVSLLYVKSPAENLETILRIGGWITAVLSLSAMVSGIIAAPGWLGGDGPLELDHHRNMGLMVGVLALAAAASFEIGIRKDVDYLKRYGAVTWFAVFLGALGTGHWGGSVVHSDRVPWDGSEPTIEQLHLEE